MQYSMQQRIRERAYEIWNTSGRMHGQADQHWLAAEREILAELTAQPAAAQSKGAPIRARRAATKRIARAV